MSKDDSMEESSKTRTVLGDLTNRPRKRGFALISGELRLKSGDGYDTHGSGKNSEFEKKVCLGIENLIKEKCEANSEAHGEKNAMLNDYYTGKENTGENNTLVDANTTRENNKSLELSEDGGSVIKGDLVAKNVVKDVDNTPMGNLVSCASMQVNLGLCKNGCTDGEEIPAIVTQSKNTSEELFSHIFRSDDKGVGVGRLASSSHGSFERSGLPTSHDSNSFQLNRCTALKDNEVSGFSERADLLKACSCSFCLKAGYIWSDLHYQDIKGRIAVLKKSQKEASMLSQKHGTGNQVDMCDQVNSGKSSKLESDLTCHWKSLFLNMEDVLVRENSELQASFGMLKDLRENCKMDLERSLRRTSEKK